MATQDSLDILNKYNQLLKRYDTLISGTIDVSKINEIQKIKTDAEKLKTQIVDTKLKQYLETELIHNCVDLANSLQALQNYSNEFQLRLTDLNGKLSQFYAVYIENKVYKYLALLLPTRDKLNLNRSYKK